MPSIRIQHSHSLSALKAKEAVSKIAERIAQEFNVKASWEDNVLHFRRPGVDGRITIDSNIVHVDADLNFMLTPIKGRVESEIRRYLDEQLV